MSTLARGTGAGFLYTSFKGMEGAAHNPAHSMSGANSWVAGSPATATRDPLFFFLHCNVDRLWAKWQWAHARNDISATSSYDLLGSHNAPAMGVALPSIAGNRTLGQYADDSMWPWDNVTGGAGTLARPSIALLQPFPLPLGNISPFPRPVVKSMIDWAGVNFTSPGISLNYGYDDFKPYP